MTAPSLLDELASEAKWLRKAAEEIAKEGHAGWGNTCTQAAECIERHHATIADMAKRLEAAERDAFKWQLFCADCDDAGEGNRAAINVVNDACRLGSGALERHYGQAARDGLDAAIAATQEGEG